MFLATALIRDDVLVGIECAHGAHRAQPLGLRPARARGLETLEERRGHAVVRGLGRDGNLVAVELSVQVDFHVGVAGPAESIVNATVGVPRDLMPLCGTARIATSCQKLRAIGGELLGCFRPNTLSWAARCHSGGLLAGP